MRTNQFVQQKINSAYFDAVISAPFGAIGVRLTDDKASIFEFTYLPADIPKFCNDIPLAQRASEQIAAYLMDPAYIFDLPLQTQGTEFQNKVWQEIRRIPCGYTLNYKVVGQLIGCGSPRAVGGACGANPYPLIVPCHRVVSAGGMGGFARHDDGFHVGVKRWLLAHEGVVY